MPDPASTRYSQCMDVLRNSMAILFALLLVAALVSLIAYMVIQFGPVFATTLVLIGLGLATVMALH